MAALVSEIKCVPNQDNHPLLSLEILMSLLTPGSMDRRHFMRHLAVGSAATVPAFGFLNHLQANVGHYGVFNGSRWKNEIAPRVRDFMAKHAKR